MYNTVDLNYFSMESYQPLNIIFIRGVVAFDIEHYCMNSIGVFNINTGLGKSYHLW